NLKSNIEGRLDQYTPGHGFSSGNLFGFSLEKDDYYTKLTIPDYSVVKNIDTQLVIPNILLFGVDSTAYGYYMYKEAYVDSLGNPASRHVLDSVLVSDDNYTQYFLWVVDLDHDEISSEYYQYPCDNDGICEQELGEDYPSCADCTEGCTNNGICEPNAPEFETAVCPDCNKIYDIVLRKLVIKEDHKPYKEAFLSGKYEVHYFYM